jgi:hypothetical protein
MVSGPASRPAVVSLARRQKIRSTVADSSEPGEVFGRLDLGSKAVSPSALYRVTSLLTQPGETP